MSSSRANFSDAELTEFVDRVFEQGQLLYRDLPWRENFDPYKIWLAEVMLQQTQVSRVDGRWQRWLERFPTVDALAAASPADVLEEWQGMGYNRRALNALACAQEISARGGEFPREASELVKLPGIGPATAAGIRAFAFNLHSVYLETNVRSVFLYELFPGVEGVTDKELIPLIDATCPEDALHTFARDPRTWYFALLDYGSFLKRTVGNPSRRSATHTKQSKFEGSRRQKRAELIRILLALSNVVENEAEQAKLTEIADHSTSFETVARVELTTGLTAAELAELLSLSEIDAGRVAVEPDLVEELLTELASEGFCVIENNHWKIAR